MAEYEYCVFCNGTGKSTCSRCNGTGKVKGRVNNKREYTCIECNGSGKVYCGICGGAGKIEKNK